MEFIHRPDQRQRTIAAIATPPGEGAIAIVRISGREAVGVAAQVFSGPVRSYESHRAYYGKVMDGEGQVIDAVLLIVMKGPRSYTGEDTVEIFCHGGTLVARRVLARVIEAGAILAEPGEFSLRAFLNGKIDLAQAEGVQQVIHAKSELALSAAGKQLEGFLSEKIRDWQKRVTEVAAVIEAWVDFPEEDLEFTSFDELKGDLAVCCEEMRALRDTFHQGKPLSEGVRLCLIGAPNVGKSSLLNALLREERAIVSPIAGTTRDVLQEDLRLGQFPIKIFDTAGIRKATDGIEQEGIRRSKRAMEEADLIVLVLDASRPLSDEDRTLLQEAPQEKTLVAWNKIDLGSPKEEVSWPHQVELSAQKRLGLEALEKALERLLQKGSPVCKEEIFLTKERHFRALSSAIAACQETLSHLESKASPEFASLDLREALTHLGSILGTNITEDILNEIFSKFCLGK